MAACFPRLPHIGATDTGTGWSSGSAATLVTGVGVAAVPVVGVSVAAVLVTFLVFVFLDPEAFLSLLDY